MARFSDDPRMKAILSRLRRRGVDVDDPEAVILALEEEIDTYRESVRILREYHKPKADTEVEQQERQTESAEVDQKEQQIETSDGYLDGVFFMTSAASELAMKMLGPRTTSEFVMRLTGVALQCAARRKNDG